MSDIRNAINQWLCENCKKHMENFTSLEALLSHFFSLSDSLYYALEKEPFEVIGGGRVRTGRQIEPIDKELDRVELELFGRKIAHNKRLILVVNPLSDKDFFRLRGSLALVGDIIHIVDQLRKLGKSLDGGSNNELIKVLDHHIGKLNKYRYARNFFAHLDERMGKEMKIHGVTGELEIPELQLKFSRDAEECFYLGFGADGTVYFHDKQRGEAKACPKSVSFGKQGMSDVFSLVRHLYDLVTSHSKHARDYPPSASVYDLS